VELHPSTSGFDRAADIYDRARAEVLDGVAERLPVADASADAITVAQAFHWFANEAALGEFARVLRPGARLAIVWNTATCRSRCTARCTS
jgi:ubiquinone/menaquinone biosynthesis C-methylase UbiE